MHEESKDSTVGPQHNDYVTAQASLIDGAMRDMRTDEDGQIIVPGDEDARKTARIKLAVLEILDDAGVSIPSHFQSEGNGFMIKLDPEQMYALRKHLIQPEDWEWAKNRLLDTMYYKTIGGNNAQLSFLTEQDILVPQEHLKQRIDAARVIVHDVLTRLSKSGVELPTTEVDLEVSREQIGGSQKLEISSCTKQLPEKVMQQFIKTLKKHYNSTGLIRPQSGEKDEWQAMVSEQLSGDPNDRNLF